MSQCKIPFRHLLAVVFLGICLLASPVSAEEIRNFDAQIKVLPDTTVDVEETIQADFGKAGRHGIYRMIPVLYERNAGRYSVQLNVLKVSDENGQDRAYKLSNQGNDVCIKVGDADHTVSGVNQYKLHYTMRRAINFFDHEPELYWNVTGREWPYPIDKVNVVVFPPLGVRAHDVKTISFMGPLGSKTPAKEQTKADRIVFTAGKLNPGEELTIGTRFPKDSLVEPTQMQNFMAAFADIWPAVMIPIGISLVMSLLWWNYGRDPLGGQPVAVDWAPPKELSPAEVGTLVDESCDMEDIVSTVVDLAVRGYVQIRELETDGFLWLSSRDYEFRKLSPGTKEPLKPHEEEFLIALFRSGDVVRLSALKERFYTHLPTIKRYIYSQLTQNHYFTQNPDDVRNSYYVHASMMIILGFIAFLFGVVSFHGSLIPSAGIGVALSGIIVFFCSPHMPAKTLAGARAKQQCLGFKRFVRMAEKERIRILAKDDPTVFGRLLPYAMVLGAADQWAEAFKDLMTEPPTWYISSNGGSFDSRTWVNDLGGSTRSMGATFASAPSASAGSGGSSFGGGGFSGGGFGGGGGGSW